ncbi:MAG: hypothetical protein KUG78_15255 [Kangiellaceae bacterium]|nr:hypothetical protein [Kangiellaceae bacterium]
MRAFIYDNDDNEYNKRFFKEGTFADLMVALLESKLSPFTIEDREPIVIDHRGDSILLDTATDLQSYHI